MSLKRVNFEKIYDGEHLMGRPMTPSYWVSEKPTLTDAIRMRVNLGNTYCFKYVINKQIEDLNNARGLTVVETFDNKCELVNMDYVIDAIPLTIVSAVMHSDNSNFTIGDYTIVNLVKPGTKVSLKD